MGILSFTIGFGQEGVLGQSSKPALSSVGLREEEESDESPASGQGVSDSCLLAFGLWLAGPTLSSSNLSTGTLTQ